MKATRAEVYAAIDGERDYQDTKTLRDDDNPDDPPFSTGDYITMLLNYANQLPASWALNPGEAPPEVLANMRKIAAIAVQCQEWWGVVTRNQEGTGTWGQRSDQERVNANIEA